MVRLAVSVEGQTEERFVKEVIVPHLEGREIYTQPVLLGRSGGDVSIPRVRKDLRNLLRSFDWVTTFYDFYGFRRKEDIEDKESLEQEILDSVKQYSRGRLIPYVQMYEFEGLLFSSPEAIENNIPPHRGLSDWARSVVNRFGGRPELINDSEHSAPSKRLERETEYRKTIHGPLVAKEIGLSVLREKCPNFGEWLSELESLRA